ncbi:hypothetical protein [Streptomyces sp. NPDC059009]|uniref:hypothetical protein n=1 Tax=Streptomyces sp. NPDC059009 TaxID=3346694 RepID=UPI0036B82614
MWYAQNPGRRTRQTLGDAAVLIWTALWCAAALTAYRLACLLTVPRTLQEHRLPLLGDRVGTALREVAHATGQIDPALVRGLVTAGSLALFLVPVGLVLGSWFPRRLRWHRQAVAARELAACDDGRELLALRALMRPLDEMTVLAESLADTLPDATPGSLAEGWRSGDPETLDALADAELERLGLELEPHAEVLPEEAHAGPVELISQGERVEPPVPTV